MKKCLFAAAVIVAACLVIEVLSGYLLWIKGSGISSAVVHVISALFFPPTNKVDIAFSPKSMYVPDDYLGYSDLPGSYTVSITDRTTGRYHSFKTTIDESGNRITSFSPELFSGKREIWIFGDSCVYGWGNNDETTFPFFLQQFLPNFRVVNYADNGYGNLHAYLQLKRELEGTSTPPAAIVIVYGDFFNERNVAAPSRLKQYTHNAFDWEIDFSAFLHPRASLDGGKLTIDYVPLFQESGSTANEKDPDLEYQHEVTKKILSEIRDLGQRNVSKLILAFIHGDDSDEVLSYARQIGYFISDIRPKDERKEWDNFMPLDVHPGPIAQDNFAVKLHKAVSEALSDSKGD